jgi:hypothetical protein
MIACDFGHRAWTANALPDRLFAVEAMADRDAHRIAGDRRLELPAAAGGGLARHQLVISVLELM